MARIDVLLPFWGDVELFKQTVASVRAQTESDWQLLIFDDCYPSDEPEEFIASIQDDRIIYERHSENIGITNNFNYALRAATAEFCVIIGCDDVMLPNYLERALAGIIDVDFYQPGVDVINKSGKSYLPLGDRIKRLLRPNKSGILSGQKLATSLCTGNWLYFPAITWRTKTIQSYGFDNTYSIVQDVLLELSVIKDGGTLYLDNTSTFQYRRFADSLSSKERAKNGVRFNEEDRAYSYFAVVFKNIGWHKASRAASLRMTSRLNRILP